MKSDTSCERTVVSEEEQIAEAMRRGQEAADQAIAHEEAVRAQQEQEAQEQDALEHEACAVGARAQRASAADSSEEGGSEGSGAEGGAFDQDLADAQQQITTLQTELSQAKDRVVRIQADWENFRRRTEQDRVQEKIRATQRLVEQLIPAIDDMERALDHGREQQGEDERLVGFVDGVEAVHTKLVEALANVGVKVIDPAGEAFDATYHLAVATVEDTDAFDETVRDVYQKGYCMGEYVVRPAMVTVTQGGPTREKDEV